MSLWDMTGIGIGTQIFEENLLILLPGFSASDFHLLYPGFLIEVNIVMPADHNTQLLKCLQSALFMTKQRPHEEY